MKANFLPAVVVAVLSFSLFRWGYLRWSQVPARVILAILALVAAVPAVLMASSYSLGIPFEDWFYEFRAQPRAEITAGLVGAVLGVMFASSKLRPARPNTPVLAACSLLAAALVVAPFWKQLTHSVDYGSLTNRWDGNVCIQTSQSTCVPACAATYFRMLGGKETEPELARAAGTTTTGTEAWYLMRAIRERGYQIDYRYGRSAKDAPVPSILGVMVGSVHHVVVLLDKNADGVTIAEPLRGRRHYTWSIFQGLYKPSGSYMTIKRNNASN